MIIVIAAAAGGGVVLIIVIIVVIVCIRKRRNKSETSKSLVKGGTLGSADSINSTSRPFHNKVHPDDDGPYTSDRTIKIQPEEKSSTDYTTKTPGKSEGK